MNDNIGEIDLGLNIELNERPVFSLFGEVFGHWRSSLGRAVLSIVKHVNVFGRVAGAAKEHFKIVAKIVARRESLQTEFHQLPALGSRLRIGILIELLDDLAVNLVA